MVEYKNLGIESISEIESLWLMNSKYHNSVSQYFSSTVNSTIFYDRVSHWSSFDDFNCITAQSESNIVGYSVTIISEKIGSIESLYVSQDFRNCGIGTRLVKKQLSWFEIKECKKVCVSTVYLNDSAIQFYKSLNIFPKTINLESIMSR